MKNLIVVAIFLSLGGVGYALHHQGYESGKLDTNRDWGIEWAKRDSRDVIALANAEQRERKEELRRQKQKEEIEKNAELEKQKALADVGAANDAADKLRRTLANVRSQFAASQTGKLSTNAAVRYSATKTISVLTNMLEESDKRAGELAQYADDASRAGAVCERTYSAVTRIVE